MALGDVGSFFEFAPGLNIAYSGSETFRAALQSGIAELGNWLSRIGSNPDELNGKLKVVFHDDVADDIANEVKRLQDEFEVQTGQLLQEHEDWTSSFPDGFKSVFLVAALYCIGVLFLLGFEQYFEEPVVTRVVSMTFMHVLLLVVIGVHFIKSFGSDYNRRISAHRILLVVVVTLLASAFVIIRHPEWSFAINSCHCWLFGGLERSVERANIYIAALFAVLPFFLHFLRVFIHNFRFEVRLNKLRLRTFEKVSRLEGILDIPAVRSRTGGGGTTK